MGEAVIKSYSEVLDRCRRGGKCKIVVAAAQDDDVLRAVKLAEDTGLADAILVGDETKIAPLVQALSIQNAAIIHEDDDINAAQTAVRLVEEGQADILMKGFINSSDFLRAVVMAGKAKKTNVLLSHLASFEIPGERS